MERSHPYQSHNKIQNSSNDKHLQRMKAQMKAEIEVFLWPGMKMIMSEDRDGVKVKTAQQN